VSRRHPWWTDADAAELDAIVHELVRAAWAHRDCAHCNEGGTWCPAMREAAEAAFEWRRARALLSRAEFLRALHEETKAA
jgi:hypothetical protein